MASSEKAKTTTKKEETEKKWCEVCPLNEWGKHAVYVAGMVGIVALVKRVTSLQSNND